VGKKFSINRRKDRLLSGKGATIVTGLRLNSGQLSIGRKKKKELRAAIHNCLRSNNEIELNRINGNLAY
jgi:hypothetical protein